MCILVCVSQFKKVLHDCPLMKIIGVTSSKFRTFRSLYASMYQRLFKVIYESQEKDKALTLTFSILILSCLSKFIVICIDN